MIDYDEENLWRILLKREGSVAGKASLYAFPSVLLALSLLAAEEYRPDIRLQSGFSEVTGSQLWNTVSGVLLILLGFRIKQALDRFWEGTGLLHQMRGEWFDSVSCCVTFSRSANLKRETQENVMKFRHTLVRLMSLCHGSALEEIMEDESDSLETIDVLGLDFATLAHLGECKEKYNFNRVEMILHLMQTTITSALDSGILLIPPPILSRVYQTLSRGFVNQLNAKKITDTQFPFPFAQLIAFLLTFNMILAPVMITSVITTMPVAAFLTFVVMFGMFSLNFISGELENPFGSDANDLPLERFQKEMNNCLLMLLHNKADHVPTTSMRCELDLDALTQTRAIRFSAFSNSASCDNFHQFERPGSSQERVSMDVTEESEPPAAENDSDIMVVANSAASCASSRDSSPRSLLGGSGRQGSMAVTDPSASSIPQPRLVGSQAIDACTDAKRSRNQVPLFSERPRLIGFRKTETRQSQKNEKAGGGSASNTNRSSLEMLAAGDLGSTGQPSAPLRQSVDRISKSLDEWSRLVEEQVGQLSQTTATLQLFTEKVSTLLDSMPLRTQANVMWPVEAQSGTPLRMSGAAATAQARNLHFHPSVDRDLSVQVSTPRPASQHTPT